MKKVFVIMGFPGRSPATVCSHVSPAPLVSRPTTCAVDGRRSVTLRFFVTWGEGVQEVARGGIVSDHLEIEQKFDVDEDFKRPDFGALAAAVPGGVTEGAPVLYHLAATYFD